MSTIRYEQGDFTCHHSRWRRVPRPGGIKADTFIVTNYYDTVEERRVMSAVEPGYLRKLLPTAAPEEGENWRDIQSDIDTKIMPGLTHWYVQLRGPSGLLTDTANRNFQAVSQFYGLFPL